MPDAGAVALNSTEFLTYGNSYPFSNGATDFTLMKPAPSTTPLVDHKEEFGDQEYVDGSQLAAEEYPAKSGEYAVVTVGADLDTPAGCPAGSGEGTGYGVGKGKPSKLQEQTAWSSSYFKVISCPAEAAVLTGGGPGHAGIGAVQSEGAGLNDAGADGISYLPFNPTSDTFGAPVSISEETPFTLDGADDLSASEDSAGGLYACLDRRAWRDARPQQRRRRELAAGGDHGHRRKRRSGGPRDLPRGGLDRLHRQPERRRNPGVPRPLAVAARPRATAARPLARTPRYGRATVSAETWKQGD